MFGMLYGVTYVRRQFTGSTGSSLSEYSTSGWFSYVVGLGLAQSLFNEDSRERGERRNAI